MWAPGVRAVRGWCGRPRLGVTCVSMTVSEVCDWDYDLGETSRPRGSAGSGGHGPECGVCENPPDLGGSTHLLLAAPAQGARQGLKGVLGALAPPVRP